MAFAFILSFSLTLLLLSVLSDEFCNRSDQFHFETSCYTIKESMQWIDGIMECRFIGAEFASIETYSELLNVLQSLDRFFAGGGGREARSAFNNSYYVGAEDQLRRGYLKWFRTENMVPESFLCESAIEEFKSNENRQKLCAVLDVNLLCIDGKNCTFDLPLLCETNCSKAAFMKTSICLDRERKTTSSVEIRTTTPVDSSCVNNLCENNSTCIAYTNVTDKDYLAAIKQTYLCDCLSGYTGHFCSHDSRPCSNYVCINNSTCKAEADNPLNFTCDCQTNFKGLFCEQNTACDNVVCLNNGNCIADYHNYICLCPAYYYGAHCEIKDSELTVLENVSASISAVGILAISFWVLFIVAMDMSRFLFKIEPKKLVKQREIMKKTQLVKRIKKRIRRLSTKYFKLEIEGEHRQLLESTQLKTDYSHFSIKTYLKFIDDEDDEKNRSAYQIYTQTDL